MPLVLSLFISFVSSRLLFVSLFLYLFVRSFSVSLFVCIASFRPLFISSALSFALALSLSLFRYFVRSLVMYLFR